MNTVHFNSGLVNKYM